MIGPVREIDAFNNPLQHAFAPWVISQGSQIIVFFLFFAVRVPVPVPRTPPRPTGPKQPTAQDIWRRTLKQAKDAVDDADASHYELANNLRDANTKVKNAKSTLDQRILELSEISWGVLVAIGTINRLEDELTAIEKQISTIQFYIDIEESQLTDDLTDSAIIPILGRITSLLGEKWGYEDDRDEKKEEIKKKKRELDIPGRTKKMNDAKTAMDNADNDHKNAKTQQKVADDAVKGAIKVLNDARNTYNSILNNLPPQPRKVVPDDEEDSDT